LKALPTAAAPLSLLSLTSRFSASLFGSSGYGYSDDYFELGKYFEKTPLLAADVDDGNFCSVYVTTAGSFDAVPSAFSFDTLRVVFWGDHPASTLFENAVEFDGVEEADEVPAEFVESGELLLRDCVTSELEERLGVPVEALELESTAAPYGGLQLFVRLSCLVTADPEQGTANLVSSRS
jgi:hypothetical protein